MRVHNTQMTVKAAILNQGVLCYIIQEMSTGSCNHRRNIICWIIKWELCLERYTTTQPQMIIYCVTKFKLQQLPWTTTNKSSFRQWKTRVWYDIYCCIYKEDLKKWRRLPKGNGDLQRNNIACSTMWQILQKDRWVT